MHTLARAIVGQQISVKAADLIWARLHALAPTMQPEEIQQLPVDALRAIGLSQSKARYIHAIADGFLSGILTPEQWQFMTDDAIMQQLVGIAGIGEWTAEMFMMFYLHRQDIWPLADIGLLKAVLRHYPYQGDACKAGQGG